MQVDNVLTEQMRFALELPADAPVGHYSVNAVVYAPTTLNPFADRMGDFVTTITQVEVET